MEDSEMEVSNIQPKIATLVFMDLESTGLPSDVGKKNVHITEISLVAVDRSSFEVDKNLRVLNKINLCIRPRSVISPFSMNITGLYNDILESQEEFDDSVPKLLEYFFRRLQKPICLLAHNGNRFDFPVLQAELKRLNYTLGSEIVCADTLSAFRSICKSRKEAEALKAQRITNEDKNISKQMNSYVAVPISDEDVDNLLSEGLENFTYIDNVLSSKDSKVLESAVIAILPAENESRVGETTINPVEVKFSSHILDKQTPQKQKISSDITENISIRRKRKILDPASNPHTEYKKRMLHAKSNILAKRTLFPECETSPLEIHKITKFSLQDLYNHFFHENPPNSHYAEVDTISLSKVCQKVNNDFLQWIDANCVSFSTVNALW